MDNPDEFDDEITRLEVRDASDQSDFQVVSGADPLSKLPEDESPETGRPRYPVLGDYLLMRKIGSGGMGRVFQARHRTMDRIVAIKMLPPNTMNSPEAVRRFRREVKAAAKLFHPNIVTAFDYREQDGIHYLAMEYVEGRPLSQLVTDHGPFTIEKTIDCAIQTAKGLDYAHSRGVIHRDIKPGNLILTIDGSIKILDMGTARFPGEAGNETNLTQSGVIMGTVNYMSPEQARDARLVDARADIYSLGCTIFFLATGAPPFQAENLMQTLMAHSQQPMPFIRDFRTDVPSWLDTLLHEMTAKQPDDRIPSMEEVVRRLQDASEPMERVAALRSPAQTHVTRTTKPLGIGIDLGCQNMRVSTCRESSTPKPMLFGPKQARVPTAVFLDGMNLAFGESALRQAKQRPEKVAERVKSFMGQQFYPQPFDDNQIPPQSLLALTLAKVRAELQRKTEATQQAVVTVPALFNDNQRKAMQEVGFIAGMDVELLNEPLAAGIAYAHDQQLIGTKKKPRTVLLVDLGVNICEVSVVDISSSVLRVIASDGSAELGCSSLDDAIVDFVAKRLIEDSGVDPLNDPLLKRQLQRACERTRVLLSQKNEANMNFELRNSVLRVQFDQEQFKQVAAEPMKRIRDLIDNVVEVSQLSWKQLDGVILAGGGKKSTFLAEIIKQLAGDIDITLLSDDAVARGAALHHTWLLAEKRGEKPTYQTMDVSSHSMGVIGFDPKLKRESNAILIAKNTPIPTTVKRKFRTQKDRQESVMIQIVQGESSSPEECTPVGTCLIENLPADLLAGTPVNVEFQYDATGRLSVFVESPNGGYRATKDLNRPGSLSYADQQRWREWVETMVLCSDLIN